MSIKANGDGLPSTPLASDSVDASTGRHRGPVEEVIAKRAKQLGKKAVSHSPALLLPLHHPLSSSSL